MVQKSSAQVSVDLNDLEQNPPPALGEKRAPGFVEAAGLCLDSQGHKPGAILDVIHLGHNAQFRLDWFMRRDARRSWDEKESTEYGAVAIGLVLLRRTMELEAIERGRQPSGFDYLLGTADGDIRAVVEISGIRRGTDKHVAGRLKQKKQQIQSGHGALVAYALVVEFSCPRACCHPSFLMASRSTWMMAIIRRGFSVLPDDDGHRLCSRGDPRLVDGH